MITNVCVGVVVVEKGARSDEVGAGKRRLPLPSQYLGLLRLAKLSLPTPPPPPFYPILSCWALSDFTTRIVLSIKMIVLQDQ